MEEKIEPTPGLGCEGTKISRLVNPCHGYLAPIEVKASMTSFADKIVLDEKLNCFLLMAPTADSIKLVAATDFRDTMDKFIQDMTRFYNYMRQSDTLFQVRVSLEHLELGGVVAIYNKIEKEWMRARLDVKEPNGKDGVYKVWTVDTSEFLDVHKSQIYYLHEKFAKDPAWVIPASLPRVVRGTKEWEKKFGTESRKLWENEVLNRLCKMVYDKPIRVRFMRKRLVENGNVWDVEMQCLETDWNDGSWNPNNPLTLDKLVMKDVD